MQFGEAGLRLLEDARSNMLKPYRHREIRMLCDENTRLCEMMDELKRKAGNEVSEELSVNYIMLKYTKERNERILRAYWFHRSMHLFHCFFSGECNAGLLSSDELEYTSKYNSILREYLLDFSVLDFTESMPPIDFFVSVITLEDCGVVMDADDVLELRKDRIYFIRKGTVAHLIKNGFVRIV
ncbi:hypothetical protein HK407_05g09340 [Ordospora pajunii]|uniref:uncharacterized protein n=1 Tax=Ordospora pajunii TaxID=3039483 RepID=UPI00295264FC|nr:uncharacterized protein HK407_05g09340 [Ordospora pajunii]KAH9411416.1 hypothetical protein HK407_05g09340 [Ordospora pajunii]